MRSYAHSTSNRPAQLQTERMNAWWSTHTRLNTLQAVDMATVYTPIKAVYTPIKAVLSQIGT